MTANHYERILRERDELAALLAAEKATRNSIIEKGVKTERERDEVNSELNKKYVEYDQLFDEAEKIKIERDEARHKLELCMAANSDVARIAKERDEARTTIEDAKRALHATDYEGILLAAMRVKEERDKARAQNAKLRDIAEWAICLLRVRGYECTELMRDSLRVELDQLKGAK
jgi:hypothetical protein